ncbi:MAG TPA: hypothetical protein VF364_13420 [Candidatus Limnocylindria bacterium]
MIAVGWVAGALAAVCAVSLVSLILLFVAGGPFGQINDVGNALIGVLSAALAFLLVREAGGWAGVAAAVVGAALTVWGSWLVMSGSTGFVLAGFVSAVGFGFIGLWLAVVAWSPPADDWWGGMLLLVRITAIAMVVGGLVAVPGALMRIDAFEDVPGWLWLFSLGWLGVYALYPLVAFALGRRLLG